MEFSYSYFNESEPIYQSHGCNNESGNSALADGGIGYTFTLNIVVWIIMVFIFFCARWRAAKNLVTSLNRSPGWASLYFHGSASAEEEEAFGHETTGVFSWIPFLFRLTDDNLRAIHGEDAIHFLSMERHLLVVLVVLMFFSIGIILPVNYTASSGADKINYTDETWFTKTTIANIKGRGDLYWVHSVFAVIYLLVIFLALWHFVKGYKKKRQDVQVSENVVLIRGLSKVTSDDALKDHFSSDYTVLDVQRVYDVHKLHSLNHKKKEAQKYKRIYEAVDEEFGKRATIREGIGKVCCCCKQYKHDAIEYYTGKEEEMCYKCEVERKKILREKELNAAFVTFSRASEAQDVVRNHGLLSTTSRRTGSFWIVSQAVVPEQIKWQNLHVTELWWWLRFIVINGLLFVLLFFFTTPSVILSSLPKLQNILHINFTLPSDVADNVFVTVYLPTLLLLLLASLLPVFVAFTCTWESHWFQYNEDQYVMRKTALYLFLIIVILPGLGLTSIDSLVAIKDTSGLNKILECIFLPSNGAFFVNYVLSSAFIGTGLELLRLPSLISYWWKWGTLKSLEGKKVALEEVKAPFAFGIEYAWIVTIFSVTVTFSIVCPLIVPFGILYFLMKYWVDKYNLYFVFEPAPFHGSTSIHFSAVNFSFGSGVILQFVILFYSILRSGSVDGNEIFSIIVVVFVLLGCIIYSVNLNSRVQKCYQSEEDASPIVSSEQDVESSVNKDEGVYLPEILKDELEKEKNVKKSASPVFRRYGSINDYSMPGEDS
ncbi:CSC1-like protein 1 [Oscarella lobularis]|uniref:CSC1-like protein 1 n=1 Tax=Oscarella lobularis TaxID=121494 RepID=UPI0033132277